MELNSQETQPTAICLSEEAVGLAMAAIGALKEIGNEDNMSFVPGGIRIGPLAEQLEKIIYAGAIEPGSSHDKA